MTTRRNIRASFGVIFTLFLAQSAFAEGGSHAGNGGDAVVCRDTGGKILTAEALDRYEALNLRGLVPNFTSSETTRADFLNTIFARLSKFSPLRTQEYKDHAATFDSETNFVTGQTLVDVPDSEHLTFPTGCAVEQLIIQSRPEFPEDKRFVVNNDIWKNLSAMDQAIMVSHEMILREMMSGPDQDIQTRELRYLNSLLFSGKILTYSYDNYFQMIQKIPYLGYVEHPDVSGRIPVGLLRFQKGIYWFNPDYQEGYFKRVLKGFENIVLYGLNHRAVETYLFYSIGQNELKVYDDLIPDHAMGFALYWVKNGPHARQPANMHHFFAWDMGNSHFPTASSSVVRSADGILGFSNIYPYGDILVKGCIYRFGTGLSLLNGEYDLNKGEFKKLSVVSSEPVSLKVQCGTQTTTIQIGLFYQIL